jgi:hypothetical protein
LIRVVERGLVMEDRGVGETIAELLALDVTV